MKLARPVVIASLAFVVTALVIAFAYFTDSLLFVSPTAASANPTHAALLSTRTATVRPGNSSAVTNSTPVPNDAPTPLPSDTPAPTSVPALAPPTPPVISSAAFRQGMMLRTDGDYQHAAESFRAVLADKPDPTVARQAQFRLGETLWLSGDDANAAAPLNAVIAADNTDNLAARAHYFLAQVYKDQRNWSAALDHLRAYRKTTAALQGEIDGEIGDIILSLGNGQAALEQYNTALKDTTLTALQRVQLLEKLSDAYQKLGQPTQAVASLTSAFNLAPDSATAAEVDYKWGLALDAAGQHVAAITRWRHAVATYPDQDDAYNALLALVNANQAVDDYQRGLVDYNYGAYDPAITAFNRYIKANPGKNASALYYLGQTYLSNGQSTLAASTFDSLVRNYPQDTHAADAAYNKGKALTGAGDTNGAVAAYNQFAASFPKDSRADDAMWSAARLLDVDGRSGEAQIQYQNLVAKYPNSPNASTSLFNIGLDYYFAQDTAHAESAWQTLAQRYPDTTDADHANFWLGKLALARDDGKSAATFFQEAAKPPRSYYSYRSRDFLSPFNAQPSYDVNAYTMNAQSNQVAEFEGWLAGWTGKTPVSSELGPAVLGDFYFKRGAEMAQLDQAKEARIDFQKVFNRFQSDPRALYALARYWQDNNYFDLSINAAKQIQALSGALDEDTPRYLRELIYPTYFADLIVPYAQQHGFDPMLFFAVVRQESMYNPLSKSWVGATGLTQVMPATGRGIASSLGVRNFALSDLYKPYVSIRFGAYFFGTLEKYFNGNTFYSLAGYNAGPGNAKKWVRPDVDVAVELIHLSESYLYVRTIYSQYNQYLEIYRGR